MFFRTGVYASLALVASAVLVPPEITVDDLGDDNAMETLAVNPFKRTVALECPGCAFASQEGNTLSWKQDVGNAFLLDFEVGAHEESLNIAGVQLFPPSFGHFTEPFYVTQVDPHSSDALRLRVTGYTFHYTSAETITEAGTELLPMTFRITSIESKPVNPPALTINLLKDVNGRLMIASFQSSKAVEVEGSPTEQDKECKEWPLLCKWRSILADRINGIKNSVGKGCHKHKGHPTPNPTSMDDESTEGKPPHTFRPGHPHHRPHHFGHKGHHHHRVHMFLRRAFFTILIPILIGIFAGTLTYLIGMAIGCLVAILVAKVRGRSPYERIALEDDEEDVENVEVSNEKEVYAQLPEYAKEVCAELPEYEAPPVYEEAAEKEVVEDSQTQGQDQSQNQTP
ncbi:hypothetical protein BS50DRAFT_594134 [Corynespora cassiicola Philippines]|uniref:DUF7728 domain-containing protein n=1 Tax=Corynespora cassiicola Philippines TaxID=1448308 RepID=A0A2T2N3I8_CORCC|nr:hypothetical protein BS50DRAFT_594134 [Corynespora cassiicola Philippines]